MVTKMEFETHVQQVKEVHGELKDDVEVRREDIPNLTKVSPCIFWQAWLYEGMVYEEEIAREEYSKYDESSQRPPFMDNTQWNHLPKIDMNTFDGSDPTSWVTQMEYYFSNHNITYEMAKLRVEVLYLDPKIW